MKLAGHIVGGVAVVLFFLSYQIRSKRALLLLQTVATALLCLQYVLIGATAGFALNIVCICRNVCYYHRDKKFFSSLFFPIFFACLMPVVNLFSYDGPHSFLLVIGLMLNTVCLGVCETQAIRKSVIVSSALIVIYNVLAHSYSGIVNESISIVAAAVGIIGHRQAKKRDRQAEPKTTV